jgi:cell division septum initiation protein DivIVA
LGGQGNGTKETKEMTRKPFSYDIDAVIGFSKEQLDKFLRHLETENIELIDENIRMLRKIKQLEDDIRHYKDLIKTLEEIKINERASKSVWKVIAASFAAIGAVIVAFFYKNED